LEYFFFFRKGAIKAIKTNFITTLTFQMCRKFQDSFKKLQ